MLNLIFFGPPGVGKGTQAAKIARHYHLIHVSTGDILRAEIKMETELGLKVKDIIAGGELVPDDILIAILDNTCDKHIGAMGFVFDGFPRTIPQAEALDEMMLRKDWRIHMVISLEVHQPELLNRLIQRAIEQGRSDDNEEAIKNRLAVYHRHTRPLVNYYRQKGIFREVDGVGSIDEVFIRLYTLIDQKK